MDAEALIVRRIFHEYVNEGLGARAIARQLTDEGVPTRQLAKQWNRSYVHRILGHSAYKGIGTYGQKRKIATEEGTVVYKQPQETWISIPFPPLVDETTWDSAQRVKQERLVRSKRNTKEFYLLQKLLRCAECGRMFGAKANWYTTYRSKGKLYRYRSATPRRYYHCYGVGQRDCRREQRYIRAERLEELVWSEVHYVLENPSLIFDVMESAEGQSSNDFEEKIARAERDLRGVQVEEDRAIRLFVSGKITETQLDQQRKFIAKRLEGLRARVEDYRSREMVADEKLLLKEAVHEWLARFGGGLDEMSLEQRRATLRMVLDEVLVDGDNHVSITLAIPVEEPVAIASHLPCGPARARSRWPSAGSTRWSLQCRSRPRRSAGCRTSAGRRSG